ncbi:biotin-dependent carboxyltransferase family protein [Bordetella sp. 15P40C-2]|uniref:5-oxoprolinase subunit C family protein n=1 Tax=Bordetella sp. 15P40C-2 TaxID=2572246 RepID=UPI001324920A|nr:biotin-dependent carboxyltransferase family protein [Bordetella sp. 15P40C-2]MVW72327.1 5-oxoprolinase/urea amidolyase family protein [Bordetella sp. 15P40C-2]
MSIHVIKPGMHSLFQDLGRSGYQRYGVPVNGAMDERAHRTANLLVGNAPHMATLEITLMGPTLRFDVSTTIAISGADLSPMVDGAPISMDRAVDLPAGATLSFGPRRSGVRAYLAVHGGYDIPLVMGSSSTNIRAGLGGFDGKPLRKNDCVALKAPGKAARAGIAPVFSNALIARDDAPIRVIPGREWSQFTEASRQSLLEGEYVITPQSDRMGYRLSGPPLNLSTPKEMLSETVTFGTIQVPTDGMPIILMADRGTSGGYPRIANVIAVDLPRLAQRMPGEAICFDCVTLAQAHTLAIEQAQTLRKPLF